jgi:hypothetical protein
MVKEWCWCKSADWLVNAENLEKPRDEEMTEVVVGE